MADSEHRQGRDPCTGDTNSTQAGSARQDDNIRDHSTRDDGTPDRGVAFEAVPPTTEIPAHSPQLEKTPAITIQQVPLSNAPDSPVFLGAGTSISEYDFELETLSAPPIGTHSTDRLVPSVYSATSILPENQPAEHLTTPFKPQPTTRTDGSDLIPNYKGIPLRWPFSLFLLAVLAGLFAFLEYEVHDLPPQHYSVLEIHEPAPAPERIAAPEPTPEPRPPEEDYPKPFIPVHTYCGWGAPTWVVRTSYIDILGPCVGSHDDCWDFRGSLYVEEQIDTFWTNDTSWCPCILKTNFTTGWGDSLGYENYFDTSDEGCRSAMFAIASFNIYKEYFAFTTFTRDTYPKTTSVDAWGTLADPIELGLGVYTMTTPPPSGFAVGPIQYRTWQYPSTDEKGNILMALVTRTAGIDMTDAFGNRVQSGDSALFPEHWTGKEWTSINAKGSKTFFLNPCFWGTDISDTDDPNGICTPTSEVSDPAATVWWTFPLARPLLSVAPSPTPPPTTTTDSIPGGSPSSTSLAPGPSPTLGPHPTATATPTSHTTDTTTTSSSSSQESRTSPRPNTPLLSSPGPASKPPASTSTIVIENSLLSSSLRQSGARSSDAVHAASTTTVIDSSSRTAEALPATDPRPNTNQPSTIIELPIIAAQDSSRSGDHSAAGSQASTHDHPLIILSTSSHGSSGKLDANGVFIPVQTDRSSNKPLLPTAIQSASITSATPLSRSNVSAFGNATGTVMETEAAPFQTPSRQRPNPYLPFPPVGPISPDAHSDYYNLQSEGAYLMVSVVPVLLSTLVLVLLQVLTASLNSILPFRALRHGGSQGATFEDSLDLSRHPSIVSAPFIAARFLNRFKDPLPLFSTLLTLFATILVTLSSEVIRLEMTSDCGRNIPWLDPRPFKLCAVGLRKSSALMRVAEGLIVVLGLLVITIAIQLARWRSGLVADPWNIASTASMMSTSQDSELQRLLCSVPANPAQADTKRQNPTMVHIRRALDGRRFRLGYDNESRYGIQVVPPTSTSDDASIQQTIRDPPTRKAIPVNPEKAMASLFSHLSSPTWEYTIRIAALVFTLGLLILILYYENTVGPVDSKFESFMNSQTIGVRILFASFGTTIDAFWNYYFSYTSSSQIHQLLISKPHLAQDSILLSPPSNIFLGLWRTMPNLNILSTSGNIKKSSLHAAVPSLEFHICFVTFLAKFTPLVLSNIPFSSAVTWKIHEVCTWLAVAFLGYMVIVLVVIFVMMDLPPRWRALYSTRIARFLPGRKRREPADVVGRRARGDDDRDANLKEKMRLLLEVGTNTIAGCMYYLCGARMLADFEGLAGGSLVKNQRERDRLVVGMGRWYALGERKVWEGVDGMGDARGGGGMVRARVDYAQ